MPPAVTFRTAVRRSDIEAVRLLAVAAGNFSDEEVEVAVELIQERLAKGPSSGYEFVFADRVGADRVGADRVGADRVGADRGDETVGYVCYGPIACTVGSYDLYWIVVHPSQQGQGLGRQLLRTAEEPMRAAGTRRIYIDTSGRPDYVATRSFYERCGYRIDVVQRDFYAIGDDRVIFVRDL